MNGMTIISILIICDRSIEIEIETEIIVKIDDIMNFLRR